MEAATLLRKEWETTREGRFQSTRDCERAARHLSKDGPNNLIIFSLLNNVVTFVGYSFVEEAMGDISGTKVFLSLQRLTTTQQLISQANVLTHSLPISTLDADAKALRPRKGKKYEF
ncbi:hypothetical protein DPEC_G00124090 [Dallia pectoralis]|uniref:Uncharacterized protein n=1 Tax=Dallia pectoralis TaxID=75939 RepID=A0ACC2GRE0_DALPE|nr:hypothetical protein DPEC_G00124090 [Dallia pectoralis]